MRTIVVSDIHGQPFLLENALKHSQFDKDKDQLVFAGDFCDIGEDSLRVLQILEDNKAVMVVGNHEYSHCIQYTITPYDSSLDTDEIISSWCKKILNKEWIFAYTVDDFLITHAGISNILGLVLLKDNVNSVADEINRRFFGTIGSNGQHLTVLGYNYLHYVDQGSPIWYRPDFEYFEYVDNEKLFPFLPANFKQVTGHTPSFIYSDEEQEALESWDFYMIDPFARGNMDKESYCKYAVIEDNEIDIVTNR